MRKNIKKWLKPVLFTAGGALVGLAYYYYFFLLSSIFKRKK